MGLDSKKSFGSTMSGLGHNSRFKIVSFWVGER